MKSMGMIYLTALALLSLAEASKYPSGPAGVSTAKITSFSSAAPVVVFTFWALCAFCFTGFFIFKSITSSKSPPLTQLTPRNTAVSKPEVIVHMELEERQAPRVASPRAPHTFEDSTSRDTKILDCAPSWEENQGANLRMEGYVSSYFGQLCTLLVMSMNLSWLLIFLFIIVGYYNGCEFKGIDNLCFYGDYFIFGTYKVNAEVMFTMWVLAIVWYVFIIEKTGVIWNWFRFPCLLSEAEFVCVTVKKDAADTQMANPSCLLSAWMAMKASFGESSTYCTTVKMQQTPTGLKFILFECKRFVMGEDGFLTQATWGIGPSHDEIRDMRNGLSNNRHEEIQNHVGNNLIPFGVSPLKELVEEELLTYFYLYQLMMYVVWFWFSYLMVAFVLFSVVCLSAVINVCIKRSNQETIAGMCSYSTIQETLRGGVWIQINSIDLVPGDVVKVNGDDWVLPCDMILLEGTTICDESGLTGESMPISKTPIPNGDAAYDIHGDKAHTLFAGTTVLQAGHGKEDDTIAVVSATGISTGKGELISHILYPCPMRFKYDEELPLVVCMLLVYALVCFILAICFQANSGSTSTWTTKWAYGVFTVSQIVSPLLPITLVVGQIMASARLAAKEVFCLNPKRIAISGKIRLHAFDKTGTLTQEGLQFTGVVPCVTSEEGSTGFKALTEGTKDKLAALNPALLHSLATCHACHAFKDTLVGNQVEVNMLQGTGWKLVGDDSVEKPGGEVFTIVKRFEFDHARMTMSVVVRDASGQCHVYCKGSPEKIGDIVRQNGLDTSLPGDYDQLSKAHALEGCYVIAMSHREAGALSDDDVRSMTRDDSEQGLSFLGLILFRNELKPDSRDAILALKEADVRTIMITGDNAQCGNYIARKSGMIEEDATVLLADLEKGKVVWRPMGKPEAPSLETADIIDQVNKSKLENKSYDTELAVTGKAFEVLVDSGHMEQLLLHTRIFARMSPEGKVDTITMHITKGLIVGMCGDGGNDCGALRAAHAGTALSEAEASVVSPFTSRTKSVQSVVDLLLEGRASLATSFGSYKFLITYGQLFSVLKLICFYYGVIMCMMDYIMIDGIAVLCISYVMTLSHPVEQLNKERPTSSLIGPTTMASVCGMQVINVIFMIAALLLMKSDADYMPWPAKSAKGAAWWTLGDNWETTVIYCTVFSQFITSGIIFTFGSHYRRSVYCNVYLTGFWLLAYSFTSFILLADSNAVSQVFHIASETFNNPAGTSPSPVWADALGEGVPVPAMSSVLRFKIWLLILGGMACSFVWERLFVIGPVRDYLRNHPKFAPVRVALKV